MKPNCGENGKCVDPECWNDDSISCKLKRRATDSLEVINTDDGVTKEELANLKQVAKYWGAGRLIFIVIVSLGALALGAVQIWDAVARTIK